MHHTSLENIRARSGGNRLRTAVALATVLVGACGRVNSDNEIDSGVAVGWEQEVRLTNDPAPSTTNYNFARDVALTDDGAVHVTWFDSNDQGQVHYARSADRGATWAAPMLVAASSTTQHHSAIAAAQRNVYIAWHEITSTGIRVAFARSLDSGLTWQPQQVLGLGGSHPSLAADGDTVHAVWGDRTIGTSEIMYARSLDRGATWSTPVQLSTAMHESWVGGVTVSGSKVIVAWVDYRDANEEEYLRISDDGGATFAPAVRMTNDAADSWAPAIAIDGSTVHFAWFDRRDSAYTDVDVELALDAAGTLVGLTFPPPPPRDPNTYYLPPFMDRVEQKREAVLAAAPAWVQNGGNPTELEARMMEFQKRFMEWMLEWEIYYKRSTDGGKTFGPDVRLTNAKHLSQRPSIIARDGVVDVVWFDGRHYAEDAPNIEVFYTTSTDGGLSWAPDQRLTTELGGSMFPSVAGTADGLHVVWCDDRHGVNEVYYRRLLR